jgi:hypothetical protein
LHSERIYHDGNRTFHGVLWTAGGPSKEKAMMSSTNDGGCGNGNRQKGGSKWEVCEPLPEALNCRNIKTMGDPRLKTDLRQGSESLGQTNNLFQKFLIPGWNRFEQSINRVSPPLTLTGKGRHINGVKMVGNFFITHAIRPHMENNPKRFIFFNFCNF